MITGNSSKKLIRPDQKSADVNRLTHFEMDFIEMDFNGPCSLLHWIILDCKFLGWILLDSDCCWNGRN